MTFSLPDVCSVRIHSTARPSTPVLRYNAQIIFKIKKNLHLMCLPLARLFHSLALESNAIHPLALSGKISHRLE